MALCLMNSDELSRKKALIFRGIFCHFVIFTFHIEKVETMLLLLKIVEIPPFPKVYYKQT